MLGPKGPATPGLQLATGAAIRGLLFLPPMAHPSSATPIQTGTETVVKVLQVSSNSLVIPEGTTASVCLLLSHQVSARRSCLLIIPHVPKLEEISLTIDFSDDGDDHVECHTDLLVH
jgi:hypothetical protein